MTRAITAIIHVQTLCLDERFLSINSKVTATDVVYFTAVIVRNRITTRCKLTF